jgi:glycosyltransferase involved in cell wall biosynthesis
MNHDMPVRGKRIAFILYNYPLLVSTSVINSIALLSKDNEVSVITNEYLEDQNSCDPWLVKLIINPPGFYRSLPIRSITYLFKKVSFLIPGWLPSLGWHLENSKLLVFSHWLHKWLSSHNYDIFMPVECMSLIALDKAGKSKSNVIYYNMELLDWEKENPVFRNKLYLKNLEFNAIKSISHAMITSPDRARIFCEINRFPKNRVSSLPVLPLRQQSGMRTRYFRDKFVIPENCLLVIYSGNFVSWAMCLEIIKSMDSWPENSTLVMHTWNKASLMSEYFKNMQEAAENRRVFFSSDFLCHKDLAPALSSADIGLMFYEALDANFTEILFSSNKMAEYLAAGIPVICSAFPSLQKFVDEHGIGKSVEIREIGCALSQIHSDMEKYRKDVDRCRRDYFEFEPHFYVAFSEYVSNVTKNS